MPLTLSRTCRPLLAALCLALAAVCLPATGRAQGASPFQVLARVDDSVVTRFEVDQRLRFLEVLRQPGITRDGVIDALIDERLQLAAARAQDTALTEDEVQAAMEEFAGRANLTADEFIGLIGQQGVAPETFRDFVRAGSAWRALVRQRLASQARVSEEELNRAIALGSGQGSVQVLLSQIVLPLAPEVADLTRQQAQAIQAMTSIEEFSAAAQEVSIAPSAANGGRLDWMPLSELPPQIAPIFLTMKEGEVTAPVPLGQGQAIGLFQLRALRDGRPSILQNVDLDYVLVRVPAGTATAEVARLRPLVSTCDTLFSLVPDPDRTRVTRVQEPREKLDGTLRGVIDTLDPGELAALPGNAALVGLCSRTPILGADLSRDELSVRLQARKLEDLADGYLAELRANAFIERP